MAGNDTVQKGWVPDDEYCSNKDIYAIIDIYREQIIPHTYDFKLLDDYLKSNYDYKDITNENTSRIRRYHDFFRENFENSPLKSDVFNPVFYEIVKNHKSNKLYLDCLDDDIYLYIEKNSGYFESNSNQLLYRLLIVRGITKEEYDDNNSSGLQTLVSCMYLHDCGEE